MTIHNKEEIEKVEKAFNNLAAPNFKKRAELLCADNPIAIKHEVMTSVFELSHVFAKAIETVEGEAVREHILECFRGFVLHNLEEKVNYAAEERERELEKREKEQDERDRDYRRGYFHSDNWDGGH